MTDRQTYEFTPAPEAGEFYARLDAPRTADSESIASAIRVAKKATHPDVSDHPDSQDRFQRIMEAAECLGSPTTRAAYDTFLARFGDRAPIVYNRWQRFGGTIPPERFTSREADSVTREERSTADDDDRRSARTTTQTDQTRSDERTQTNARGTKNGRNRTRPGHSQRAYSHRQSYERKEYEPPESRLGPWLGIELRALGVEIGITIGLALLAGLLLVGIVFVGFVFGAVAVAGTVVGAADLLSQVAVFIMETVLYGLALAASWIIAEITLSPEWDDRLGNRIRFPEVLLLAPVVLTGSFLAANFEVPALAGQELAYTDLTGIHLSPASETLIFAGVVIMGAYRVARIARETPPGGNRESLRGTIALLAWGVSGALVTLAFVSVGLDGLLSSYPNPYEETYLWWWLDSDRLLALACLPTAGLSTWTTGLRGWHWLRRRQETRS